MTAFVLDVPFAMRGVATAEAARWDAAHGVFIYEGLRVPRALAPFRAQPYSWEMRVQQELADDAAPAPAREAARKKVRTKKGLARAGTAPDTDVIVLDESHRCKNPTAARSRLAAKLVANAGFTLWLSATAGQNPLELSYLAPVLAAATGARAAVRRSSRKREPRRPAPPPRGHCRLARDQPHSHAGRARARGPRSLRGSVDGLSPRIRPRAARQGSPVGARRDPAPSPEELADPRGGHGRARARSARQRPPDRDLGRLRRDADRAARSLRERHWRRPVRGDPWRHPGRRARAGAAPLPEG